MIMYLPVSPVAPPKRTALVLFTMKCQNALAASEMGEVSKQGERTYQESWYGRSEPVAHPHTHPPSASDCYVFVLKIFKA